jgi:hypothetical protein
LEPVDHGGLELQIGLQGLGAAVGQGQFEHGRGRLVGLGRRLVRLGFLKLQRLDLADLAPGVRGLRAIVARARTTACQHSDKAQQHEHRPCACETGPSIHA